MTNVNVPEYRYFSADLLTGRILMEIPFSGVSWERKINSAGTFSGSIAADVYTQQFDLYNSTLPGKTAIYVMRNGVCVWGGVIWSRDYSISDKVLSVSASEFVSYLFHRKYWKSFATDIYQASNNSGTGSDADTIKSLLETLINAMSNDQDGLEDDELSYGASDVHCRLIAYERSASGVGTVSTEEPHGFDIGDVVIVYGVPVSEFNGTKTVTAVSLDGRQFSYSGLTASSIAQTNISATATTYAVLRSTSELLKNAANINLTTEISSDLDAYVTEALGDNNPFTFRGSDGNYVGDIIRNFSTNGVSAKQLLPVDLTADTDPTISVRFDYYIESRFDSSTQSFYNVFKAWLVRKDINNPSLDASSGKNLSELYGPSELGANNLIFEHPGNISSLSLTESADSAATRTWVIDNNSDVNEPGAKYYGAYTNMTYLESAGYPILETVISDRDLSVSSDEQVAPFAKQLSAKLAPPIGSFNVSVNGSLKPEVGSYKPGDWCVVIPNDAFINERLKPPYENRENLLVRKILSVKVSVPDFPTFPEQVDLELVPEWEDGVSSG